MQLPLTVVDVDQLELPLGDPPPESRPMPIAPERRVYVNRDLKVADCHWVGFDMDYTLALYHQREMDQLSIAATADKLCARGYPQWIRDLDYPVDFPIRGLLIDKHLGHVLKMNRFKIVRKGFHGLRELDREELGALYYEKKVRHKSSRYHWIDTLYGLSEACMYAAIIDAYERRSRPLDFAQLFTDIRECIDEAHRDGTILDPVMRDTDRYIHRDHRLAATLHKLRSGGKQLFLLTNSRWEYTRKLLSYLLDDALPDYQDFQRYFDALIVAAKKPAFFEQRQPLMERVGNSLRRAQLPLERGRIYEGGNIEELQQALGVPGNQVLYVGDHIYGDMVRSKKDSTWRTAMIIPELEVEIAATGQCREDQHTLAELYHHRTKLEDSLRHYQQRLKQLLRSGANGGGANDGEVGRLKGLLGAVRQQLRVIEQDGRAIRRRIDQRFHPYWGSLLKEGGEQSMFGAQVDEYACIYTSRVSNLLAFSPHQYFRSPPDLMHHEL